jgi:hypothetical protein
MSESVVEHLVQIGMRSVIRDIQEYIDDPPFGIWQENGIKVLDADDLRAYLLACMITAGGYDELPEGVRG